MPQSGKYGALNGVKSVANWTVNDAQALALAIDSGTGGGTERVKGISSWDGTYLQNMPEPAVLPGTIAAFQGFTAPDDGTPTGVGVTYEGNILSSQLVLTWDFAGGSVLTAETTFLGHLALVLGSANVQDATISAPYSICGTKIEVSTNGTDWSEITDVSSATLTLLVATQDYVNSSTGCWTGRNAGPKDWTAAIVLDSNKRNAPVPQKGDAVYVRFYVSGSAFWELKWGIIQDFTGIVVDRTTGNIIQQTMNVAMKVSDGSELGYVKSPSDVYWFGEAPGP